MNSYASILYTHPMVRNKEKYQQVVELRKRGFTYSEIANMCDIAKATVSNWLKEQPFSQRITIQNKQRTAKDNGKRIKLVHKARNIERSKRYAEAVRSAETEFKHYRHHPLFVAGLSVYMVSGDSDHPSQVRLSSNSFAAHKIFVAFLLEFLGLDKKELLCWVFAPPSLTPEQVVKKWSREIKLPVTRFGKTQFTKSTTKKVSYGTATLTVGNAVLKRKLLRWQELLLNEVNSK
jgi:Orotate phosphoribosyltransferase homologs